MEESGYVFILHQFFIENKKGGKMKKKKVEHYFLIKQKRK